MPSTGLTSGTAILEAVEVLSQAFQSGGLQPSSQLTLADAEQGRQLVLAIKQQLGRAIRLPEDAVLPTIDADGSTWIEAQVRSILVRWPATRGATPGGQLRWE